MGAFYILWPIFCGIVIPLLIAKAGKGFSVNININHKQDQTKVEYNESMANMLPKEVQEYYHGTNGANKF